MINHLKLHTVPDAADPPRTSIKHDVIEVEEEAEEGGGEAALMSH